MKKLKKKMMTLWKAMSNLRCQKLKKMVVCEDEASEEPRDVALGPTLCLTSKELENEEKRELNLLRTNNNRIKMYPSKHLASKSEVEKLIARLGLLRK